MKQIFFIICTIFTCICTTGAQVTISTSDLAGTKWQTEFLYNDNSKSYDEYTQKGECIWHSDDNYILSFPYYLSSTIPTKFDTTKVGKNTKGCYIVEYNPKGKHLKIFSIQHFNKTEGMMILRCEDKDNIFAYGATETYLLMPIKRARKTNPPVLPGW